MSVIDSFISGAKADEEVLQALKQHGDDNTVARNVAFVFVTSKVDVANALSRFINEQRYGNAYVESSDVGHRVLVNINMPIQQHVILSVSGFMSCLATQFDLQYDGWGCPLTRSTPKH